MNATQELRERRGEREPRDPHDLRRQLDELDALLDRMLKLPLPARFAAPADAPASAAANALPRLLVVPAEEASAAPALSLKAYAPRSEEQERAVPRPAPLSAPPPIASIPERPGAGPTGLKALAAAFDDRAEALLPPLAHAGLKRALGWLGLAFLAGAAALAAGAWLGLNWRP